MPTLCPASGPLRPHLTEAPMPDPQPPLWERFAGAGGLLGLIGSAFTFLKFRQEREAKRQDQLNAMEERLWTRSQVRMTELEGEVDELKSRVVSLETALEAAHVELRRKEAELLALRSERDLLLSQKVASDARILDLEAKINEAKFECEELQAQLSTQERVRGA